MDPIETDQAAFDDMVAVLSGLASLSEAKHGAEADEPLPHAFLERSNGPTGHQPGGRYEL